MMYLLYWCLICYICAVNFKWYIVAFISMVSIFVVQQQETVVHNQEIVLHFTSVDLSKEDAQHSITILIHQLEKAGALDIKTVQQDNGRYKISYHSSLDVTRLKEQLNVAAFDEFLTSQQQSNTLPFEDHTPVYQMDVYELQQDNSGVADTDNALLFEIKQDFNRGSQVNHVALFKTIYSSPDGLLEQVFKSSNHVLGLRASDRSYAIPAVRAGPISS